MPYAEDSGRESQAIVKDQDQRQLLIKAIELANKIIESDSECPVPLVDGLRERFERFIREAESKLNDDGGSDSTNCRETL
jgi:hypothetical protein